MGTPNNTERSRSLGEEDKAIFEYGKKAFLESIDTIKNFIQLMIPVTTGLTAAYFALLEFLEIKTVAQAGTIGKWAITEPAVMILLSLGAFILASFPVPWPLSIGNESSIRSFRNAGIVWKYSASVAGAVLFLIGITRMIFIVVDLISP